MRYLYSFVYSLLLTLVIEHLVAFAVNERGKRTFIIVTLVNVLTNPPVVLCWMIASRFIPGISQFTVQIPLEIIAIITEAFIYRAFSVKKGDVIRHPVFLSIVCNVCSYGSGVIISQLC